MSCSFKLCSSSFTMRRFGLESETCLVYVGVMWCIMYPFREVFVKKNQIERDSFTIFSWSDVLVWDMGPVSYFIHFLYFFCESTFLHFLLWNFFFSLFSFLRF